MKDYFTQIFVGKLIGAIGPEGRTLILNKEMEAPEKEPSLDRLLTEIEQVAERERRNACDELALAISGGVVEEGNDIPMDPYEYLGWYFIERMDSSKFERLKEEFLELTDEIIAQEELRDLCAEIRGEKDPSNRERLVNTLHAILMQESNDAWEKARYFEENPQVASESWQGKPEDLETLRQLTIQNARAASDDWKSQAEELMELFYAEHTTA